MSKSNTNIDDWMPCSPGSLSAFAGQERTRQRRVFLSRAAGASAAVLIAISAGYFAFDPSHSKEPNFGGVTCSIVRKNAPQFMAGKLDPSLTEQIRIHLEQCPDCQRFWKEMAGKAMAQVSLQTPLRYPESCGCEDCRQRQLLLMPEFLEPVAKPAALDQRFALSR